MCPSPRSAFRRLAAASLVAAMLMTGESLAQSLPSAPVPDAPVRAPAVPAVPPVPDADDAPSPPPPPARPQVPSTPAPVRDVDPPTPPLPRPPSVPDVPAAPAAPPVPAAPDAPPVPAPPADAAPVPGTPSTPKSPSRPKAPSAPSPDLPDGSREAPRRAGAPDQPSRRAEQTPSSRGGSATPDGASGGRVDAPAGGGSDPASGSPAGEPRAGSLLEALGVAPTRARAGGEDVTTALRRSDRFTRTASQRRLRRVLERHGSCLARLPAARRRIVLLRVGVEGRRPLSRREVARRLDIPADRVAAEERAAVRRLRSTEGGCSGGDGGLEGSTGGSGGLLAGVGAIDAGAAARGLGALLAGDLAGSSSAGVAPRNEVAGARASSSDAELTEAATRRDVSAGRTLRTPFGTIEPTSRESVVVASLFAVGVALAALLLVRSFRRRRRTA